MSMKQIFFIFILFFSVTYTIVYAEQDPYSDYTLIDCVDGNDETWTAFDSTLPYQTLKAGIEKTISYINQNVNISWNAETASWKTFSIKVNCTTNDLLNSQISLWFNWKTYNNELLIEWVWDNGLIVQDMYFYIPNNTGHVVFKNAKFLDNSKFWYYFKLDNNSVDTGRNTNAITRKYDIYNYFGIYLRDSYINLQKNTSLWLDNAFNIWTKSCATSSGWWCTFHTYKYSYYFNQIILSNSVLDIDISWNYMFKMPFLLKDSKLNFNNSWTWSYNVTFANNSNTQNKNNYWNTILMSNEIDMWWNNFSTENKTNIAFINNKFSNFWSFNFSWNALYFNNTIENKNDINISSSKNLINNVFSWSFIDTYDKNNLRRNYSLDNIWTKWIGWFFRIKSGLKYFNTEVSSYSLYKEITGQDLAKNKEGVSVIYNK